MNAYEEGVTECSEELVNTKYQSSVIYSRLRMRIERSASPVLETDSLSNYGGTKSVFLTTIKLQRVIQEFRILDPEMQMQTALAFLYIAERDLNKLQTTVGDVGEYLNLSSASASRNVAVLSRQAKSKWGHELVYVTPNPERRNEKFLSLSPKGKAFLKRLEGYIDVSSSER